MQAFGIPAGLSLLAVLNPQSKSAELNSRRAKQERRAGRRFQLGWRAEINGQDVTGTRFEEAATLKDLSSGGALFYLTNSPGLGAKLNVLIKLPFENRNLMVYSAEAVRIERHRSKFRVAVKFSGHRPKFRIATADSNSSGVYPRQDSSKAQ
jgi:hypothetical protein